ncbi:MAG: SH3 domain-containing protein [Bacteroidota bacterium]
MTHLFKYYCWMLLTCCIFPCCNNQSETPQTHSTTPTPKPSTNVTGVIYGVQSGKDGYSLNISTADTTTYTAMLSVANMENPKDYTELYLGETVTLSGELLDISNPKRLIVRNIEQRRQSELCWLTDVQTYLYSRPDTSSKQYGVFFKGENLTILADPVDDNGEIWTKVYFRNTVKAGYEDQFADGRPMHEGIASMVGWIRSETTSQISCK